MLNDWLKGTASNFMHKITGQTRLYGILNKVTPPNGLTPLGPAELVTVAEF
jgi:hypothetical protein